MVWRIHFSETDLARVQVRPTLGPLAGTGLALGPPDCTAVDLPTLFGETATIEQGIQALLDVPREHLLVEMEWIDRRHRLPPLAWAMAEAGGGPRAAGGSHGGHQG